MRHRNALSGFRSFAGLVLAVAVMSCSDSPSAPQDTSGPQPGSAAVRATTNPWGAAAFVLRISGGPVEDVQAGGGTIFWEATSDGALAVVVLGEAATGEFATVRVPDLRTLSDYQLTVVEASDTSNEPLSPGAVGVQLLQ